MIYHYGGYMSGNIPKTRICLDKDIVNLYQSAKYLRYDFS